MKFLLQTINNAIAHDFVFEITQAKHYYDWLGRDLHYVFTDENIPITKYPDEFIPIGSVEFVSNYIKQYYPNAINSILPLNVPECLFSYAGRKIVNVLKPEDMNKFNDKYLFATALYTKSLLKIKDVYNGPIDYRPNKDIYVNYQVSEYIDIDSEWRVFVFKNEIQHIANYSGDCTIFPNINIIKEMIKVYSNNEAPVAYIYFRCGY